MTEMTENNTSISQHQQLIIKDRKELTLDGVKNVQGFGEDYLRIETVLGILNIEGSELKIESLTKEDGKIRVVGNISGVFYENQKTKKGFFSGIFG